MKAGVLKRIEALEIKRKSGNYCFVTIRECDDPCNFTVEEAVYRRNTYTHREFELKALTASDAVELYKKKEQPKDCDDVVIIIIDYGNQVAIFSLFKVCTTEDLKKLVEMYDERASEEEVVDYYNYLFKKYKVEVANQLPNQYSDIVREIEHLKSFDEETLKKYAGYR